VSTDFNDAPVTPHGPVSNHHGARALQEQKETSRDDCLGQTHVTAGEWQICRSEEEQFDQFMTTGFVSALPFSFVNIVLSLLTSSACGECRMPRIGTGERKRVHYLMRFSAFACSSTVVDKADIRLSKFNRRHLAVPVAVFFLFFENNVQITPSLTNPSNSYCGRPASFPGTAPEY
jgi:hypothetical protein